MEKEGFLAQDGYLFLWELLGGEIYGVLVNNSTNETVESGWYRTADPQRAFDRGLDNQKRKGA